MFRSNLDRGPVLREPVYRVDQRGFSILIAMIQLTEDRCNLLADSFPCKIRLPLVRSPSSGTLTGSLNVNVVTRFERRMSQAYRFGPVDVRAPRVWL